MGKRVTEDDSHVEGYVCEVGVDVKVKDLCKDEDGLIVWVLQ